MKNHLLLFFEKSGVSLRGKVPRNPLFALDFLWLLFSLALSTQ